MSIDLNYFARNVISRDEPGDNVAPSLTREEGMVFAKSTQDMVMLGGKIQEEKQRALSAEKWLENYAWNGTRLASYAWVSKAEKSVDLNGKMPDLVTIMYGDKYHDIAAPFLPMGGSIYIPVIVEKRVAVILHIHIEPIECTVKAYVREDDKLLSTDISISQQIPPWVRAFDELERRVAALEARP